ncbi:MAG: hypothetical protein KC502_23875 [Myxococcales bacterium]|nr:hypothetical protein [Myxococcales bacterium]
MGVGGRAALAVPKTKAPALSAHKLATHMYKSGKFKEAARLYLTAYKLDPKAEFLFNAARAEQRGMMLGQSERHFRQVLALPGVAAKTAARAQMHISEIAAVRKALSARASAARASAAQAEAARVAAAKQAARVKRQRATQAAAASQRAKRQANGDWRRTAGWATTAGGVVVSAVGGWLLATYASEQASLDKRHSQKNEAGQYIGLDYATYESEQTTLWRKRGAGIGAAVVGVGALATGVWWLLSHKAEGAVALRPVASPTSAGFAWRF